MIMTNKDYTANPEQLLPAINEISLRACDAILAVYNSEFTVEHKDDKSPLTAADMASHHSICNDLRALTPDIPILSEESAELPYAERKTRETYWLVDPLDGTKEFIKRNGEFTVNIALIHRNKPILGAVFVPVSRTGYFASIDTVACKISNGSAAIPIQTKRTDPDQIIVAGSRSHGNDQQDRFLESLGAGAEILTIGSSLKFCLLAEGKIDIYARFGPTSEWDTAAAQCVVEQAGGMVTDMQFRSLQYNTKDSLLNPDFLVIADRNFDWKPLIK